MQRLAVPLVALALLCAPPAAWAQSTRLHFIGFAAGFRVVDLAADLVIGRQGYDASLNLQTLGVVNVLARTETTSEVHGRWIGDAAMPDLYNTEGVFNGEPHRMTLSYRDGQPSVTTRLPDNADGREPVAPPLQANTIDSLSAIMALLRRVADNGSCDGRARVFDGRRLSEIVAHTVGPETLPATSRSVFEGSTLRCDFTGTELAGFKLSDNRARVSRPQHGSVWLASLAPGGPMVPVRVSFHTGWVGDTVMYLVN